MPLAALASARRCRLPATVAATITATVAALFPRLAGAQAGAQAGAVTVIGYVTDSAAVPIPAAEVRLAGTAVRVRTDDRGAFRIAGLSPGTLTLTVRRLGFHARSDKMSASPGDTLQIILDLVALPAALAEVTVTGKRVPRRPRWLEEFESRRERGFGTFVTRADIEKRGPLRTSDLFRTIVGVSVLPGSSGGDLRMARSMNCAPDIYIDGLEARGFRIDDIPPMDIAGIEVFRGPAETPVRFRRFMAGCGVVSIWTREPGV